MVVPPRWGARVGYRQSYDPILRKRNRVFLVYDAMSDSILSKSSAKLIGLLT